MATLYYGGGQCSIEGHEIRGVQIEYEGAVEITSKCGVGCKIRSSKKVLVIYTVGYHFMNDLFSYVGQFKIKSVKVTNNNLEGVPCSIKRVMDYAELLNTEAEDLTTNSENLSDGYNYKKSVRQTSVDGVVNKEKYLGSKKSKRKGGIHKR